MIRVSSKKIYNIRGGVASKGRLQKDDLNQGIINRKKDKRRNFCVKRAFIPSVMSIRYFFIILLVLTTFHNYSQSGYSQVVRGIVKDKDNGMVLPGANVVLMDSAGMRGVSCDKSGNFRIENVNSSRHILKVSFVGYKDVILPILVHSARELVLTIEMEESVVSTAEIQVTDSRNQYENKNQMATASVMKYNVEEAFRYAGSMSDPARMVMNYAGVTSASEMSNELVIRGNSPSGLLWLLDDVEIPNPNHFAAQGTTGGPISMLTNNVLLNSDFYTAAFPAEYSQAFSGVFDLKLRTGNNERHEYTILAGILGLETTLEGPFSKNKHASYLINYRYSTMDLIGKIINLKISGVPRYQDIITKLQFPLGRGSLSFFSIAGNGKMSLLDSEEEDDDFIANPRKENYYLGSELAASGISYNWLNKKQFNQKILISSYYQKMRTSLDTLGENNEPFEVYYDRSNDKRLTVKYFISKKIRTGITIKSGFSAQKLLFNLDAAGFNYLSSEKIIIIDDKVGIANSPNLYHLFSQGLFRLTAKMTLRTGISFVYFDLTNKKSVEPRIGLTYNFNSVTSLYFAYGLHSKTAPLATLYAKTKINDNEYITTNTRLNFSKTHHVVAGFSSLLNNQIRLKTETYFQYLYAIPVEAHPSSFSLLNISNLGSGFNDLIADSLVNEGTGVNYGFELSLEKYFSSNFYFLMTLSLFDSKYHASDKVVRNTEFNSNYIFNLLGGREIEINQHTTLYFSLKAVFSGGKRFTPIDHQLSRIHKNTVRILSEAYSLQYKPYYKFDIKAGLRFERRKFSHEISVTVDNFTNHKNEFRHEYNVVKDSVITQYQLGIIPGFYYRVYF